MDEQPTNRGGPLYWLGRRSWRFWIAVAVLLPVLYVLSFGLAGWGFSKSIISEDTIKRAYSPILAHEASIPATIRRLASLYSAPAEYDYDMIAFLNQADSRRERERLRKLFDALIKELDEISYARDARLRALQADSQR